MSEHEPEADAAQQEAVRRLLAEARHVEPLPPDVGARLDDVLAALADEGPHAVDPPAAPARTAVVVDLDARRRRRARGLLGAAAAVVVLGVGATQLVDLTGAGLSGDDSESSTAADSGSESASSEAADEAAGGGQQEDSTQDSAQGYAEAAPEAADEPPQESGSPGTLLGPTLPTTVPQVGRRGFPDAVVRLRDAPFVTSLDDTSRVGADDLTSESLYVCPPTAWGAGRLVPVVYAGAPAVLVYRPATGDTQSVELLQCGTATVLRSVVIPFP